HSPSTAWDRVGAGPTPRTSSSWPRRFASEPRWRWPWPCPSWTGEPPAILYRVSTTVPDKPARTGPPAKYQAQRQGIILLAAMVAVMWIVEIINTIDSNSLDNDGIWPHNVSHLWGILTAPFLHASFGH